MKIVQKPVLLPASARVLNKHPCSNGGVAKSSSVLVRSITDYYLDSKIPKKVFGSNLHSL